MAGVEKEKDEKTQKSLKAALDDALQVYSYFLKKHPVLTKSLTSAFASGLGQIIAQKITSQKKAQPINFRPVAAFAAFGFVLTGPLLHYFYQLLDQIVPKTAPYWKIKRVFIDRVILIPPFLLLFFYVVSILEGKSHAESVKKIKEAYWTTLKMNWRVWTPIQFFNLSYVPLKYRVLFGNMIALLWSIYLAKKRASSD